jgi:DNA-binding transcriptional MerR regulator
MTVLVTIGDFSHMTHLSVKALRHYHDVGLLEPASIDTTTGYRYYDTSQVTVAQVIRRFRDLGMPIDEVKAVITAPDLATRSEVIVRHLKEMESRLAGTQAAVASLRNLMEAPAAPIQIEYRSVPATSALAIAEMVAVSDGMRWWTEAFDELHKAVARSGSTRNGPDGALYTGELFEQDYGEIIAFVPVVGGPAPAGGGDRVVAYEVPAAELAVTVHRGEFDELDRTYGALGTFVAERELGVEGPIREYYVSDGTPDGEIRIEVGWPIFRTRQGAGPLLREA